MKKKILALLALVLLVTSCGTERRTIIYEDSAANTARLYIDRENHMSAVYRDGTPYYFVFDRRSGTFVYQMVPMYRVGYLESVKTIMVTHDKQW